MDRWQRSSSRVTEIDFGWWRCNQALLADGRSEAASTVTTSSRGKPEKSTPRGPTWMWVRSSLSRVPLSAARHAPLPSPPPPPGSILCSLPSALVLLCIDNASVHRSGKSFHASSSLLRSSFSFYSTREWWEMLFFFFLMISFYRVSMIFMWYVWREFDGWKIGVEKEISDRGLFVQLTSFRGLNSCWIKT